MKCVNCDRAALYEYRITQENSQFYCDKHLPRFLEARKRAGTLALTERHKEASREAIDLLRATPAVVEAPKRKRKPKTNEGNS